MGLGTEADRKADHAGAGEQRPDVHAERGQDNHDDHRDQRDEQEGAHQR